jgi:TetR/AcrR family transcriptional regulator of autoinduction and epiphytic fitness
MSYLWARPGRTRRVACGLVQQSSSPSTSPTVALSRPPSPSAGGSDLPIDGRSARALRTREAILDACISLVEEGELRPTAPRVAERAHVSVRSVFQHFDDLPSLHIAVTQRIAERVSVLLHPVDPEVPFDQRLAVFVRHRGALLEALTPFQRAGRVHGPFSPEIRQALRDATGFLRDEAARAFAPELDRVPAPERREVLDGLAIVLSWSSWDALRSDDDRSVDEAAAVTRRLVRSVLACADPGPGLGSGPAGPGSAATTAP